MKKLVAGMDLHSNNVVIGVMDLDGLRVASGKVACDLKAVEQFLAPFKPRLEQVAVESTYNWYWLVDGLQAKKYPVSCGFQNRNFLRFSKQDIFHFERLVKRRTGLAL